MKKLYSHVQLHTFATFMKWASMSALKRVLRADSISFWTRKFNCKTNSIGILFSVTPQAWWTASSKSNCEASLARFQEFFYKYDFIIANAR